MTTAAATTPPTKKDEEELPPQAPVLDDGLSARCAAASTRPATSVARDERALAVDRDEGIGVEDLATRAPVTVALGDGHLRVDEGLDLVLGRLGGVAPCQVTIQSRLSCL